MNCVRVCVWGGCVHVRIVYVVDYTQDMDNIECPFFICMRMYYMVVNFNFGTFTATAVKANHIYWMLKVFSGARFVRWIFANIWLLEEIYLSLLFLWMRFALKSS